MIDFDIKKEVNIEDNKDNKDKIENNNNNNQYNNYNNSANIGEIDNQNLNYSPLQIETNNKNNKPIPNHDLSTYDKQNQSTGITGEKLPKMKNKDINSDFISEKMDESKSSKNHSIKSFDINVVLNEEKVVNRENNIINIDINERFSQSMDINNIRRGTVKISECSENITDASGDRKDSFFRSNYESEIHNIKIKPICAEDN